MNDLDPLARLPFPGGAFQVLEVLHLNRETLCASKVRRVAPECPCETLHGRLNVFYAAQHGSIAVVLDEERRHVPALETFTRSTSSSVSASSNSSRASMTSINKAGSSRESVSPMGLPYISSWGGR